MGELKSGYPGEPEEERQQRMDANRAEYERRRREDTWVDELGHRIKALVEFHADAEAGDLAGHALDAVCAVHALMVAGKVDLNSLAANETYGLQWLAGLAELDNDLSWCGNWHVGGPYN